MRKLLLLVVLFCFYADSWAIAEEKVRFQRNLKNGFRYEYEEIARNQVTDSLLGQKRTRNNVLTFNRFLDVGREKFPDGTLKVETGVIRFRIQVQLFEDRVFSYDTAKPDNSSSTLREIAESHVAPPVSYRVNDTKNSIEPWITGEGAQSGTDEALAPSDLGDLAKNIENKAQSRDEYFVQGVSKLGLDGRSAAVGEAWQLFHIIPFGLVGSFPVQSTYEFEGWHQEGESKFARVLIEGERPEEVSEKFKDAYPEVSGFFLFDPELGMVRKAEMHLKLTHHKGTEKETVSFISDYTLLLGEVREQLQKKAKE